MLWLPDVRQRDDYDCGHAACVAASPWWGLSARDLPRLANPIQGTPPDALEAAVRSAGAGSLDVLTGSLTLDDLAHFTRSYRPVITLTQHNGSGHWVVVCGVDRWRVHYHCPIVGRCRTSRRAWLADWRDSGRYGESYVRWGLVAWPRVVT